MRSALFTCVLATAAAAPQAAADPARLPRTEAQFAGDAQRSGRSAWVGPHRLPSIRWRVRAGRRVFASPVVSTEGAIVFAATDGTVHGLDTAGVERWAFTAPARVFATPAALGDSTLVGHDGGALVSVDARGAILWRHATPENVDAPPLVSPTGSIYVASRRMDALDARGQLLWTTALGAHVFGAPACSRDGSVVVVADGAGEISWLRARDGSLIRRVQIGARVYGGVLVLDDDAIVVGAADGHVRCFGADGTLRWDVATRDEVRATPARGPGGVLIVGSDDGGIYGLRADDGTEAYRVATAGRVRASARIDAAGYAFVGSEDDQLYAIDPRGAVAWTVTLGGDVDSSVAISPQGDLLVGCDDGTVYDLAAAPMPPAR